MGKTPIDRQPLLPDRRPQPDFFVCDIFDAAPKSDMSSMEHPIFSLSTKPDCRVRRYEHGQNYVEIIPSAIGLATVHDRDVLIFCISQLISALNDGREVSKTVRFQALDLLQATNRDTGGKAYKALRATFDRLRGTTISTNIVTGDVEQWENFGLIESSRILRKTRDGRMLDVEITLSDWVFNAIRAQEVLTLHPHYFRLRKPLERRMYELARKHCGRKSSWKIGLELLHKKCGSNSTLPEFRRLVKAIVEDDAKHGHMPDYAVCFDDETDDVIFKGRGTVPAKRDPNAPAAPGPLDAKAYEAARAVAPKGLDVYQLEQSWRAWCAEKAIAVKRPGPHFVKFCKSWAQHEDGAAPQPKAAAPLLEYKLPPSALPDPEQAASRRRETEAWKRFTRENPGASYGDFLNWWKPRRHLSIIDVIEGD